MHAAVNHAVAYVDGQVHTNVAESQTRPKTDQAAAAGVDCITYSW